MMRGIGKRGQQTGMPIEIIAGIVIVALVVIGVAIYFITKSNQGGGTISNLQPEEIDTVKAFCQSEVGTCGSLKIIGGGRYATCEAKQITDALGGTTSCTSSSSGYESAIKNDCESFSKYPVTFFYSDRKVTIEKKEDCSKFKALSKDLSAA
jgi:hypothetical protein